MGGMSTKVNRDGPTTGPGRRTERASAGFAEEQVVALPTGIDLCYQTIGDPGGRPLLLVMGLGGPMTWWPEGLCARLADDGFFVIRYDNRDTGRSTRLREHRVRRRDLARGFLGRPVRAPYSLADMGGDAVALLDHLGITAAHVAGVSMGGMIAQTIAVEHPDRVLSLTSIMSTTGVRTAGFQHPMLLPGMLRRTAATEELYVEGTVKVNQMIGSPGYPDPEEVIRARARTTWSRGVHFGDTMRHMLAVVNQPNRTRQLAELRIPVTVVHGLRDRMVHVSGGRATAAAIPGAELMLVPGMGHDIPIGLFDTFVEAISRSANRVTRGR